jgi:hypothetical protein
MLPDLVLEKLERMLVDCLVIPYHSAIGKLLYVTLASQPDIAFTVGHLSQFTSVYGHPHWAAVKHLLCYLKGIGGMMICYDHCAARLGQLDALVPIGYCDADWGGT